MPCATHYKACECREAAVERLREAALYLAGVASQVDKRRYLGAKWLLEEESNDAQFLNRQLNDAVTKLRAVLESLK